MSVRVGWVVVAVALLTSCGSEPDTARDPAVEQATASPNVPITSAATRSPRSTPSRRPTQEAEEEPSSNADALATGLALLRNGGVVEIGEAEPPHGDNDANLGGTWGGHAVIATVRRTGDPMLDGEILERLSVADVQVLAVQGSSTFLRFPYGGFTVDLSVVSDSGEFLGAKSKQLTGTILCPSECGDLPEGADG